jgi:hypothetical protein
MLSRRIADVTSRLIATTFALAALLTAQQSIGPDEVRGGVEPYTVPATATPTIRTQVSLVEVPVIVRNGKRIVTGLQREDFKITDSGHPRDITSSSVETLNRGDSPPAPAASNSVPAPNPTTRTTSPAKRHIAFLFDDLNIPDVDFIPAKKAAKNFFKSWISSGDRAALATTAWPKPPIFTSDAADLEKKVEALHSNPRAGGAGDLYPTCPFMNFYETYQLANYLDPQLLSLKIRDSKTCSSVPDRGSRAGISLSAVVVDSCCMRRRGSRGLWRLRRS